MIGYTALGYHLAPKVFIKAVFHTLFYFFDELASYENR
jgi:hypothetical protein